MLHTTQLLHAHGATVPDAARQAGGLLYGGLLRQSAMLAFADAFWVMAVLFVLIIPLMFLMKRTGPMHGPLAVE
jgi:DHA2 family multidrug resistance protein